MADVDDVMATLVRLRFRYQNEVDLQDGIEKALTEAGMVVRREARLTARRSRTTGGGGPATNRIDMLVGDCGIEVKVDGSAAAVRRQLHRYAECTEIGALVLVTTRSKHLAAIDATQGIPMYVVPTYAHL